MEAGMGVKSSELIEFQGELRKLSENLEECYELLCDGVKILSETWQDEKYEEFTQEFKETKEKIIEISEKYKEWADNYLPPRIEQLQIEEGLRVGLS